MTKLKAILMILVLAFALTSAVVLPCMADPMTCYAEPPFDVEFELTGH